MPNDPSSVSVWTIVILIVSGIVSLLSSISLTLGVWILNNVRKSVMEVKETAIDAHKRIDDLEKDRTQKWIAQGKECAEEKAQLREVQTIIKYKIPKDNG